MNDNFSNAVSRVPALFALLRDCEPFREKGVAWQEGKPGIYAFFEDGVPVHVGRTRHLQRRLRGHITRSHSSASFAFKRVRKGLGRLATYQTEGSRSQLMIDPVFRSEFEKEIARTRQMDVRFVEVADPVLQYLLELYACLEWNLPLDEFNTH